MASTLDEKWHQMRWMKLLDSKIDVSFTKQMIKRDFHNWIVGIWVASAQLFRWTFRCNNEFWSDESVFPLIDYLFFLSVIFWQNWQQQSMRKMWIWLKVIVRRKMHWVILKMLHQPRWVVENQRRKRLKPK